MTLPKINTKVLVRVSPFFAKTEMFGNIPHYIHEYQVSIINKSKHGIQLISRHWEIIDGAMPPKIVKGEGVIGEKPKFFFGDDYTYHSWCTIYHEIGQMSGYYEFEMIENKEKFIVNIPAFSLIYPGKLN